jgi:hypothetical protein
MAGACGAAKPLTPWTREKKGPIITFEVMPPMTLEPLTRPHLPKASSPSTGPPLGKHSWSKLWEYCFWNLEFTFPANWNHWLIGKTAIWAANRNIHKCLLGYPCASLSGANWGLLDTFHLSNFLVHGKPEAIDKGRCRSKLAFPTARGSDYDEPGWQQQSDMGVVWGKQTHASQHLLQASLVKITRSQCSKKRFNYIYYVLPRKARNLWNIVLEDV